MKSFEIFYKAKLKDAAYDVSSPSANSRRQDFILNNLDSDVKRLGISFNSIARESPGIPLFVPTTVLSPQAVLAKDLVLRSSCIQTGCLQPEFFQLASNICQIRAAAKLCAGITSSSQRATVKGLSFRIANIGLKSQPRTSFALTLQSSAKLLLLAKVDYDKAERCSGKPSVVFSSEADSTIKYSLVEASGRPA